MDRQIIIKLRDKYGAPLPGADMSVQIDGVEFAKYSDMEGHAEIQIPEAHASCRVGLVASYKSYPAQSIVLAPGNDAHTFQFPVRGIYSPFVRDILSGLVAIVVVVAIVVGVFYLGVLSGLVALVLGVLLIVAALGLAFIFSKPNLLQAQLVRATFALGCGGVASEIPGLLNVNLSIAGNATIAASGAIAAFVIVFFFTPARYTDGEL